MGHHRWFRNQLSPSFSVLRCPLGVGELQARPFPDVVFPPLPLSALSSSPFHCALQDGFGQTCERETWPYHCSLRFFPMVRRSSCGPIACCILARTSSLVTWSLYEMRSILRQHLISMACILLWSSAVRVHDSQAYRKMDVTRESSGCYCHNFDHFEIYFRLRDSCFVNLLPAKVTNPRAMLSKGNLAAAH